MSLARFSAGSAAATLVGILMACGTNDRGFSEPPPDGFDTDAGAPTTPPACALTCSVDLRSVVSCDGAVVETCGAGLGCSPAGCVDACTATAEARSSLGCDFYMQPPPTHPVVSRGCYAAYLVNAWDKPATLGVEYRGKPADATGAVFTFAPGESRIVPHSGPVAPGETVVVFLSNAVGKGIEKNQVRCPPEVRAVTEEWPNPDGSGIGGSFRITSDVPLSASTIYPFGGALSYIPSATLLLPVAGWGKQHIIVSAWSRVEVPDPTAFGIPGAHIVASEDDTEIAIRPVQEILNATGFVGSPKGVVKTYRLSRGQSLQLSQGDDLTGSTVESTRPTAVFGGHSCMYIPSKRGYCDSAQQQLPSIEQWGNEYAAVGHVPRMKLAFESSPYRLVAGFDGTELTYDPAPPAGAPRTMKGGEVATFYADHPFVVRSQGADQPIYLAEYMTGGGDVSNPGNPPPPEGGFDTEGDPEFVNVVPSGQYLNKYTFYADPTFSQSSVVVVRPRTSTGFKDVWLECAGANIATFAPIGTEGRFEYARLELTRKMKPVETIAGGKRCGFGVHTLRSEGPFAATLWGWGVASSYAYPGGTAQRKLVTRPLVVR